MKKFKIALCSFGMSGRVFHAPFIHVHHSLELVGAWERSNKQIQHFYPYTKSYNTYDELLQDDIDVVVVNTPTYTHFEYAKKALENNKHIIVEKAFTTTVEEAIELKKIAEQQNKHVAVFQNRRWDSDFKTVQKIVASNQLGNLCDIEFHFDRYNLDLSPKQHKEMPNPGAGIVKDLAPHIIDQALCLFGMPQKVFADIRQTRPTTQVDDCFNIILYYPTFRVTLKASYIVKYPLPSYILHGSNGSFIKHRSDVQETLLQQNTKPTTSNWANDTEDTYGSLTYKNNDAWIEEKIVTETGNYYDYYDAVYKCLNNESTTMPITAIDGINVMSIIEAAYTSNNTGRVVSIDTI